MECVYAFIALALVVYLLPVVGAVIMAYEKNAERARKIAVHDARLADMAERRATAQAIREAKLAEAANKVVLSDQKIELEQLKIRDMKRKLGDTDYPFNPDEPS